jgi:hypothetical protein
VKYTRISIPLLLDYEFPKPANLPWAFYYTKVACKPCDKFTRDEKKLSLQKVGNTHCTVHLE